MDIAPSGQTKPEKTAKIISVVIDSGDFGFETCGNCGETLDDLPERCPHCGIKLEGIEISPPTGGSDF